MEEVVQHGGSWLLTQGVLGLTTMILLFTTAYLYRSREQDRKAHALELASERKLVLELQEKRLVELRSGFDAIAKSTSTLETALAFLSKGRRSEQAL